MRISSNDSVVFLMGPTASGKTELALEIFDRFDVCLISVDSALIYRGMDIGTAKPSKKAYRLSAETKKTASFGGRHLFLFPCTRTWTIRIT